MDWQNSFFVNVATSKYEEKKIKFVYDIYQFGEKMCLVGKSANIIFTRKFSNQVLHKNFI